MLTALISVCSLATVSNLGDCTRDSALDLVYVSARSPAGHLLDACPGLWGRQLDRTRSAAGVNVVRVRGPINRVDSTLTR